MFLADDYLWYLLIVTCPWSLCLQHVKSDIIIIIIIIIVTRFRMQYPPPLQ